MGLWDHSCEEEKDDTGERNHVVEGEGLGGVDSRWLELEVVGDFCLKGWGNSFYIILALVPLFLFLRFGSKLDSNRFSRALEYFLRDCPVLSVLSRLVGVSTADSFDPLCDDGLRCTPALLAVVFPSLDESVQLFGNFQAQVAVA